MSVISNPAPDLNVPNVQRREFLYLLYRTRPCFICQAKTWCAHREPLVDLAEHCLSPEWIERSRP